MQDFDERDQYEFFRWSVIQDVVDLFMLEGRDSIMADVAEEVVKRLNKGIEPASEAIE
jgi:hypothetical protein